MLKAGQSSRSACSLVAVSHGALHASLRQHCFRPCLLGTLGWLCEQRRTRSASLVFILLIACAASLLGVAFPPS